jgi:hypothetical protein
LANVTAIAADDNHTLALIGTEKVSSWPRINIRQASGNLELSIFGQPGGRYVVESADSLTPPLQWQFHRNLRLTTNSTAQLEISAANTTKRFFRVRCVR